MFFTASTPPARFSIPLMEGLLPWVVTVSQSASLPSRPPRSKMPGCPFRRSMTALHLNAVASYSSAPSILLIRREPPPPRGPRLPRSFLCRPDGCWCGQQPSGREEELGTDERFMALFRVVFEHPPEGRKGGKRLFQLQQGAQTTVEYALTFRTVAASSGWNEIALRTQLREEVQTELACRDDNISLDALIVMAIHLDNLLRERPPRHLPDSFGSPEAEPEPMAVGATHFSATSPETARALSLLRPGDAPASVVSGASPNPGSTRAEGQPRDLQSPRVGVNIPLSSFSA
ncbi:uncharacterized protein ACWYII_042142 isoform 1-T5 [Salvelinus alpinus]